MRREPICLPFDRWPARDQALWRAGAAQPASPFDAPGAGAAWSPRSWKKTGHGYARYLGWLQAMGRLDHDALPETRVTPEWVREYLETLKATCAPWTLVCRIQELHDALRVLAPNTDQRWLLQLMAEQAASAKPIRDKRPRLRMQDELTALGRALMAEATNETGDTVLDRARMYRDGLMIALLASRPIRLRAFSGLRIGTHLVCEGDHYVLALGADDTKSRRPFVAVLPGSLSAAITGYLDHHRPVLLARAKNASATPSDALWISERGTAMTPRSVPIPIVMRTTAAFGCSLPPHWFRHCAATTVAIRDPKHVGDIQHILGHASARPARNYNLAGGLEASRRFQAMMNDIERFQPDPNRDLPFRHAPDR